MTLSLIAQEMEHLPFHINDNHQPPVTVIAKRPSSSIDKVLGTPELLEMILAQTDMRTLLVSAQRVCQTWKNIIDDSRYIQQCLFFEPVKGKEPRPSKKCSYHNRDIQTDDGKQTDSVLLNPLLKHAFASIFPAKRTRNRKRAFRFRGIPASSSSSSSSRSPFAHKDASWRRMLVSQPPLGNGSIGLFELTHYQAGDSAECFYIPAEPTTPNATVCSGSTSTRSNGLRMDHLLDALLYTPEISFDNYTYTWIAWATEDLVSFNGTLRRNDNDLDEQFGRMLRAFGVVIFTETTSQCCTRDPPPRPCEPEMRRRRIVGAFRKAGVDVEGRRSNIRESKTDFRR
ncbi:uncharacterized protein BDV14DRAFT_171597 [Aspergillus stella-maris]|uniref:uncharacterized protein n=1 Tax=Aspergillus stella-maris TaxID=1810926 RepID=UPI003CCD72B6